MSNRLIRIIVILIVLGILGSCQLIVLNTSNIVLKENEAQLDLLEDSLDKMINKIKKGENIMYPTVKELHKRKDVLDDMSSALNKDKEAINKELEKIEIEYNIINSTLKLHGVTK